MTLSAAQLVRVVSVLTGRELLRFLRQPSRVAAAVLTPIFLLVLLGSGLAGSFAPPGAGATPPDAFAYARFLFPGMLSLTVVFASIFAALSLIDDRHSGFLQSVLVAPVPTPAVALAKLLGGALVAAAQALLILPFAYALGLAPGPGGLALAALVLLAIALGMNGLGLALAWRVDSVQGFHGIMNLVIMPMWLLSGAFFPAAQAAPWLSTLMLFNPLTWATSSLRIALAPQAAEPWPGALLISLTIAAAGAGVALALLTIRRRV